ncbi:MAG: SoxR reducing system RseC family protein [Prevotella sp.]|nr:SoxR reducing system RseC family protein [Bacteroides sp.]MCM1366131.1 SoxR reducing system RseC family protein [Prevotella sp.]MCM1436804.1 SoxR reducing system RseC family protein [Prevotella sp.]
MNDSDLIEHIEHTATVSFIDSVNHTVTVSITDADECGQCPAAALCTGAKNAQKVVISTPDAQKFKPGEHVKIFGTEQMHRRAIMLATVIPCILLIAIMTVIFILTANQLTAALGGLAAMFFFFMLLYICRNKIAHEFQFKIKHISQ